MSFGEQKPSLTTGNQIETRHHTNSQTHKTRCSTRTHAATSAPGGLMIAQQTGSQIDGGTDMLIAPKRDSENFWAVTHVPNFAPSQANHLSTVALIWMNYNVSARDTRQDSGVLCVNLRKTRKLSLERRPDGCEMKWNSKCSWDPSSVVAWILNPKGLRLTVGCCW